MFSGLVMRMTLVSLGRFSAIDCVTTGMVIRKMISSTSITSTRGVVLIAEIASSSLSPDATFIAILASVERSTRRDRLRLGLAAKEYRVQVGAKAAHGLHRDLVAPDQPVVAKHRGN